MAPRYSLPLGREKSCLKLVGEDPCGDLCAACDKLKCTVLRFAFPCGLSCCRCRYHHAIHRDTRPRRLNETSSILHIRIPSTSTRCIPFILAFRVDRTCSNTTVTGKRTQESKRKTTHSVTHPSQIVHLVLPLRGHAVCISTSIDSHLLGRQAVI